MKDINKIIIEFRNCLEKLSREGKFSGLPTLINFPRGSCGTTSRLLGAYLENNGHGVWNYMCGYIGKQSHAWLEKNGMVIDITSDQFSWGDKVYYKKSNEHKKIFSSIQEQKYNEQLDGKSIETDRLYIYYKMISECIRSQNKDNFI